MATPEQLLDMINQLRAENGQLQSLAADALRSSAQASASADSAAQAATATALAANQTAAAATAASNRPVGSSSGIDPSRLLKSPETFNYATKDLETKYFSDWAYTFKSWVTFLDPLYGKDLDSVEEHLDLERPLSAMDSEQANRAKKLHGVLCSYLRQGSLRLHKSAEQTNGIESWRRLHRELNPVSRQRALALLQALNEFPAFTAAKLLDNLLSYEELVKDYERVSKTKLGDPPMFACGRPYPPAALPHGLYELRRVQNVDAQLR